MIDWLLTGSILELSLNKGLRYEISYLLEVGSIFFSCFLQFQLFIIIDQKGKMGNPLFLFLDNPSLRWGFEWGGGRELYLGIYLSLNN